MRRFIFTEHETVAIPEGMEGTPIEDVLLMVPDHFKGARVFKIDGRRYIAQPHEIFPS